MRTRSSGAIGGTGMSIETGLKCAIATSFPFPFLLHTLHDDLVLYPVRSVPVLHRAEVLAAVALLQPVDAQGAVGKDLTEKKKIAIEIPGCCEKGKYPQSPGI